MSLAEILQSFARDTQVHAALILITADVLFGVLAALKTGTFRLVRIADTLRDDALGKVAPWFGLFAIGKVSHADVASIDFSHVADAAFLGVAAALGASILGSLAQLGVSGLPKSLAGEAQGPPPSS